MKKAIFVTAFIINFLTNCKAQHPVQKQYVDMLIKNDQIFALTVNGRLHIIDANKESYVDSILNMDKPVKTITFDKNENIVAVTSSGEIGRLNYIHFTFDSVGAASAPVHNIIFTHTNKLYLITTNGILDMQSKISYLPDTSLQLNKDVKRWAKPKAVFVDSNNNIWLGYGFGEWGAELYIFSTATNKFIKPALNSKVNIEPVRSIFSDGKTIYVSGGLQHMFSTFGSIVKFDNFKGNSVLNSVDHKIPSPDLKDAYTYGGGEDIGPALYNKKDNCIYFYSQNGIFRGNITKDLSDIENWVKLIKPKLHWQSGQPDAAGPPINVLKMQFAANGKLILLTQNDGIGVYDQKGFRLIN